MLEGFVDASKITSICDDMSTPGWVFIVVGGVISWSSKKGTCVSHSIVESEFMVLATTEKQNDCETCFRI